MGMELILKTDMGTFPKMIEFNYEELKDWLAGRLEDYDGRVVTEGGIKEAKADRATLNRLATFIDDERKAVKAKCLAPYEEFERKTKELVGMIKVVSAGIDGQIKAFDAIRTQEKYDAIWEHYDSVVGDLAGLVPLDRVMHPKWSNVGTTLKEACDHVEMRLGRIRLDLDGIDANGGVLAPQLKDYYLNCLDLGATLVEKTRLEKYAELMAERERRRVEPPKQVVETADVPRVERVSNIIEMPERAAPAYGETERIEFWVEVTPKQKQALRAFLISQNIKYGKVTVTA